MELGFPKKSIIENDNYYKIHYVYDYKEITEYTYVIKISEENGIFWFVGQSEKNIISYTIENNTIHLNLSDNEI